MKPIAAISVGLLLATCAFALTPAEKGARLSAAPITVYPDFDVAGTVFVGVFNELARPGDALVVSHFDAFKGSARIAQLGVTRGEVWVHTSGLVDLAQGLRRNFEGARGLVFVPAHYTTRTPSVARELHEDTATLRVPLIVGLVYGDTRTLDHVDQIARNGEVITVYANQVLARGAAAYRQYVERVVSAARAANPTIKVEVAVSTGKDEQATRSVAEVLRANIDLADRVGVYCNESPESAASLRLLVGLLRGS